jgi:hypothetical protein
MRRTREGVTDPRQPVRKGPLVIESASGTPGAETTVESALKWPLVIVVFWDVCRTSKNGLPKKNQQARDAVVKAARDRAYLAWKGVGSPQVRQRLCLDVVIRRGRSMDTANVWDGMKPIIDGCVVGWERRMVIAGQRRIFREPALLPDDSPRWLALGKVKQDINREWSSREEIELRFSPAE